MRLLILSLLLISCACFSQNKHLTISGKIVNKSTGLPLPNCNIAVIESNRGTVSDTSGNFIIYLPEGKYHVQFSHIGFKTKLLEFYFSVKNGINSLIIEMDTASIEEQLVTIYGEKQKSTVERQKLDKQDVVNMPNLYSDALRSIQILPGVTSNNELSSSYNVRGGNFDENLMYLNGFQIYRPFLLKQGVEENQSIINPNMLKDMQFYPGGFSAKFGDKMASALEITYMNEFSDTIHGNFKSDLLNLAGSLNQHYKNLNYNISARYGYPGLFLNKLHTTGSYAPFFADIQGLFHFDITQTSSIELLVIYSENRFKFSPYEFDGNFQQFLVYADGTFDKITRGIKINFNGSSDYSFNTKFAGLRFLKQVSDILNVSAGLSLYDTKETEFGAINSDVYYSPNPETPFEQQTFDYLKSRVQFSDNGLKLTSGELQLNARLKFDNHDIEAGTSVSSAAFKNRLNENTYETSADYTTDFPFSRNIKSDFKLISYVLYALDNVIINDNFRLNYGVRYLNNAYTKENLISPRLAVYYYPSKKHTLNFSWGHYYQPPMYYEFRNKANPDETILKSQKAIFYLFGWDFLFKEKVKFQVQTYYKKLDRLIPYYVDQLKIEYGNNNNYEGYAYGIDMQFQGEITKDVQSWIGYSYLNTTERNILTGSEYLRRFLDQTHTVQIFLQDKFPKHPNWQSHVRIIFGSGFLYPLRKASLDSVTHKQYVNTLLDQRAVFPFYMRADMGLTVNFHVFNKYGLRILAEVLNVFNKQNIANYIWMQTFKEFSQPVWVPQMYSERFFNFGLELIF